MPKKAKVLSALAVAKLKTEGRHAVGGADGLYLRVAGVSRGWVLCVAFGTRTNRRGKKVVRRLNMGLGPFPDVSLAEAREKALEHRKQVREGIDPLQAKREAKTQSIKLAAKAKTFAECANLFMADKRSEWTNTKHIGQWGSTLRNYAYPLIGAMPVALVDVDAVLLVLRQEVEDKDGNKASLWNAKNQTASRIRGRIEAVLDWAKVSKYRQGENPAAWQGNLRHALPAPAKIQKVKHLAALPYAEIGSFMTHLRQHDGMEARALEFAILTAARSGEVCGATWSEINLKEKTWTIPAERMKAKKQHRVPLSDDAVKLLKNLPRLAGKVQVFPAPRRGVMTSNSLIGVLKRMGHGDLTQHGFRSTFKDWARSCKGTDYADEVSELALAHVNTDATRAAYARDELMPLRANLMKNWAEYCDTATAKAP
jgi:integrase